MTSYSYGPVLDLADSCKTGAANNIINGLALGYKSTVIPVMVLTFIIFISFYLLEMYGIAIAALGFQNLLISLKFNYPKIYIYINF